MVSVRRRFWQWKCAALIVPWLVLLAPCPISWAADAEPVGEPIVLLDAAKLEMADGRLRQAREALAEIPLTPPLDYVAEEVLFQRLLLNAAFLSATHYLLVELEHNELAESTYGRWLGEERAGYADALAADGEDYLTLTASSPQLDFVRFRLPLVTGEHLADTELYTDPEILSPAVTNWDDGREGLGKGLVAGQARVALVLAAARYYDLPEAAATIEEVAVRLRSGVPVEQPAVLEWLAEVVAMVPSHTGLARLSAALSSNNREPGASE